MNESTAQVMRRGPPTLKDAIEPFQAGAKPHDMSDEHDIGDALTLLADQGEPVTVYSAGDQVAMARIRSVDPHNPRFVLELIDGAALAPGEAVFVAWLRSAKLQFKLSAEQWPTLPGQPHLLALEFPVRCQVLNRRASSRLETPLGIYYMASFVLNGKPYELQLYDFSSGGVGMRAPPRDCVGLHVGRKLQRVRLELGPESVIIADLEVRLSRTYRSFLLGEQVQIGCQFSNLSPNMKDEVTRLLEKLHASRNR